jgi:hypothetical protein
MPQMLLDCLPSTEYFVAYLTLPTKENKIWFKKQSPELISPLKTRHKYFFSEQKKEPKLPFT